MPNIFSNYNKKVPRVSILAIIVLAGFALFSRKVFAHVLQTDGSIGAVLHIAPDDDPVANQPAKFVFEITDKDGKFSSQNCVCVVKISRENQEIFTTSLFAQSQVTVSVPVFQYTFEAKGLYALNFSGKPKPGAEFQPFSLRYDVRVDKLAEAQNITPATGIFNLPSGHGLHIILFGSVFAFFFIKQAINYYLKRKNENK